MLYLWYNKVSLKDTWKFEDFCAGSKYEGQDKWLNPTAAVGCDYLSLRFIPALYTQVLYAALYAYFVGYTAILWNELAKYAMKHSLDMIYTGNKIMMTMLFI